MTKKACTFVLLAFVALGAIAPASAGQPAIPSNPGSSKTLLWKVTSPHRTLFLAGEVLVLSSKDYPLPDAITKTFSQSGELVTEGAQAAKNPAQVQQLIHELGVLPPDQSLSNLLTDAQLTAVKQAATAFGLPFGNIAHLQPWLAFIVLRNAADTKYGIDTKQQLGAHLYAKAHQQKMQVSALESTPYQLKMFASIPTKQQATWLTMVAKELVKLPDTRASIVRAWRTGDTAQLAYMSHQRFVGHPRIYKILVANRNQRWLRALDKLLETDGDPVFVVVGAGHFFGPSNLLVLLRADGFTVTQL